MGVTSIRPTVVIIDDETSLHRVLSRSLARHGYEAVCLASAVEAERCVLEVAPIAVLCDHSMPACTGPEFATRLREQLGADCPALFLMTGRLEELPAAELELFDRALPKPFRVGTLVQMLDELAMALQSSWDAHPPAESGEHLKRPVSTSVALAVRPASKKANG